MCTNTIASGLTVCKKNPNLMFLRMYVLMENNMCMAWILKVQKDFSINQNIRHNLMNFF